MNPKDMNQPSLRQLSKDLAYIATYMDRVCFVRTAEECRLAAKECTAYADEADALRKENKELRKESFALYARLNEYSYQFIYGGRSGVRTAYVLAAPVLASYRLSHPDGFDAKEIEARS